MKTLGYTLLGILVILAVIGVAFITHPAIILIPVLIMLGYVIGDCIHDIVEKR